MPTPQKKPAAAIAACLIAIDKTAEAIQLFPAGDFDAPLGALKGRGPWRLDSGSAGRLITAAATRRNAILIDYEHQSLSANKEGHPAPAAGWIDPGSLIWRDDGLYAQNPLWNARAAAMIAADEYRYLSPVFTYDTQTGAPLNILSVALTNTPAIDGMSAVSLAAAMADYLTPQENAMDLSELMDRLCYLLNLPVTTTPEEMAGQLDKLKTMLGTEPVAATSLTDLLAAKDVEIAALKTAAPDPAKYVPVAALLAVQQQRRQEATDTQEARVAALIAAHPAVIVPALEAWAKDLGGKDINQLQDYINMASPIAALTATQTGGNAPGATTGGLNATELAVCAAMGMGADHYKQTRDTQS